MPLKAFATNERKNYSPVVFKLDGYTQVPRQAAAPYSNVRENQKHDAVAKRYLNKTAKFFGQVQRQHATINASASKGDISHERSLSTKMPLIVATKSELP